jgi:HK97 family phage portal protein
MSISTFFKSFLPVKQVKSYVPVQTQSFFGWLASVGRDDVSKTLASVYYAKCYPVNSAIGEISDRLKNITPVFLDNNSESVEDDLTKFLKNPNGKDRLGDILNKININYKLTGEIYLVKTGITRLISLDVLASPKVSVLRKTSSYIQTFSYASELEVIYFDRDDEGRYWNATHTAELVYYHEYNIQNEFGGLSPLSSIALEIEQYLNAGSHNLAMLSNEIKPSLILSSKNDLMPNREQLTQFKELLDEFYRGSSNAGNYLITGNFDAQTVATRSDMDYKDLTNATRNAIFQKLGVPLTIADTTASTYNNRQLDQLTFYDDTVIPLFKTYLEFIIRAIKPEFKNSKVETVAINETDISALSERALANLERRSKIGHMTINELRIADNYSEVENGDIIYKPANDVPIASADGTDEQQKAIIAMMEKL